ncbi:MAG TPA: amidohydrolase family protein, partial [Anaerolineaceae bacterium]
MNLLDERARLVEAALGKAPADLVIRGGNLVNVHTREIYPADVVIQGKRIAAVLEAGSPAGAESEVIRADGMVLVPGFIDPHIHIESSAVTVKEYARVVVPRGVTTVAEDPHEIANVLGIPGFELFFAEAKALPLRLLLRVPGKVPGISADLETSGGEITLDQTKELLAREAAVCLAGDINPNLLIRGDRAQLEKIAFTQSLRKTVSGQSPGLQGSALNAFIAAGPEDSHVSENAAEVLDIIRHGLRALITHREDFFRIGDYRELAELIRAGQIDTRMLCFCSDDVSPHLLLEQGSIDARVRLAIRYGMDPVTAIQMATINVADLLRLDRDLGSISPGKIADIAILSDLEKVTVDRVLFEGKLAAQDGRLVQEPPPFEYPDWAKNTIHIQRPLDPADIPIRVDESQAEVSARVIQMGMPKEERVVRLPARNGSVLPDPEQDVLSVAVLD